MNKNLFIFFFFSCLILTSIIFLAIKFNEYKRVNDLKVEKEKEFLNLLPGTIVYECQNAKLNWDVCIISASGENKRIIYPADNSYPGDAQPEWAENGTKIYFTVVTVVGTGNSKHPEYKRFSINADSTGLTIVNGHAKKSDYTGVPANLSKGYEENGTDLYYYGNSIKKRIYHVNMDMLSKAWGSNPGIYFLSLTPDNKYTIFFEGGVIVIAKTDGTGSGTVTQGYAPDWKYPDEFKQ